MVQRLEQSCTTFALPETGLVQLRSHSCGALDKFSIDWQHIAIHNHTQLRSFKAEKGRSLVLLCPGFLLEDDPMLA